MSSRPIRYVAWLVLMLGACSGGDDESSGGEASGTTGATASTPEQTLDDTATVPTTTEPVEQDSTDSTPDPAVEDTTTTAPATAPTTAPTSAPALAVDVGRAIVQTTPSSGNPPTPTLIWEAVDGAVSYTVLVADADGATWWSWEGVESEVVFGGVASGSAALQTEAGATWTVLAHGADGRMLAASPRRPLDP